MGCSAKALKPQPAPRHKQGFNFVTPSRTKEFISLLIPEDFIVVSFFHIATKSVIF